MANLIAEVRVDLLKSVTRADATAALMHPPWAEKVRRERQREAKATAEALAASFDVPWAAAEAVDSSTYPPSLRLDSAKIRLMMGQKPETARRDATTSRGVEFEDARGGEAALGVEESRDVLSSESRGHRPLRVFGSQLVRGGAGASPPRHRLDVTGAGEVLFRRPSARGRGRGRGEAVGGSAPRRDVDNMPMHERYAMEMARQTRSVRTLVAANKASLLADIDSMLGEGWVPPAVLLLPPPSQAQGRG